MDNADLAQEGIEHARHREEGDAWTLRSAMLIAALAAGAVVAEMSANDAQTRYLAAYIGASDTWAQYQAKSVRRTIYQQSAEALRLARASPAAIAANAREAARLASEPGKDGMRQLAERAKDFEKRRDEELRLRDAFEHAVRGLQIAVVLTSLSVAVRIRWILLVSLGLGVAAVIYALGVAAHAR